jgi:ABC-type dipeptide/oligopeptide/nickel transport system permease component
MIIKRLAIISIALFLLSIVSSGCMYLMEEDPWELQREMNERKRINKEQEVNKQQSTTDNSTEACQ